MGAQVADITWDLKCFFTSAVRTTPRQPQVADDFFGRSRNELRVTEQEGFGRNW